jgi:hypothetical protein
VLLLCGEQIGMNAEDFGHPIDATVFAVDWYNSGEERDVIGDVHFSPLGERYFGIVGANRLRWWHGRRR